MLFFHSERGEPVNMIVKRLRYRDCVPSFSSWCHYQEAAFNIDMAIRRLEELQCFNTAEVVLVWAWTAGIVTRAGCDDETLRFYRNHGTTRLIALRQHIIEEIEPLVLTDLYLTQPHGSPVRSSQGLALMSHPKYGSWDWYQTYYCLAQVCQVRRLYHLFEYDPATWKEVVAVGVDGETDLLPGCSVIPAPFVDWVCDYP